MAIVGSSVGNVVGPSVGTPSGSSINLLNGLQNYWPLDEESGTRYDAHGSYNLSDVNTCSFATGKVSNAADFVRTNSEYLSGSATLGLHQDFAFSAWVKVDALDTNWKYIFTAADVPTRNNLVILWANSSHTNPNRPRIALYDTGGANAVDWSSGLSAGVWYHVYVDYSYATGELRLSVNNGTPVSVTVSTPSGVYDTVDTLEIGRQTQGATNYFDGNIDEVALWSGRILTDDERAYLYNSGNGRSYADLQSTFWSYASLAAAESSGDAWQDGDDVWIVGGPQFKYYDAIGGEAHSGLIHANPFNDTTEITGFTSAVLTTSTGEDPDTWDDCTTGGGGVKSTDYEIDSSGGYSRLRDLTTTGSAYVHNSGQLTSAETSTFLIMRDVSVVTTLSSGVTAGYTYLHCYENAGSQPSIILDVRGNIGFGDWIALDNVGNTRLTGYTHTVDRDIWVYHTNDKIAIWFGEEAAPAYTSTASRTATTDRVFNQSWGDTGNAGTTTWKLTGMATGGMTTS